MNNIKLKYLLLVFPLILFFIHLDKDIIINASSWKNEGNEFFEVVSESANVYDIRTGKYVKVGKLNKGQIFPRVGQSGNYHKIVYGDFYGYVHISHTKWHSGNGIKSIVTGLSKSNKHFVAKNTVNVIDISTGKFVVSGEIESGTKFSVERIDKEFYKINYAGKVGFVYKSQVEYLFNNDDEFFQVLTNKQMYDIRTGKYITVGEIESGQIFPRKGLSGNYHRVPNGDHDVFIHISNTVPVSNVNIKNLNLRKPETNRKFKTKTETGVFDISSGKWEKMGTIPAGVEYTIDKINKDHYRIIFGGRTGFLYKSNTQYLFNKNDKYAKIITDTANIYDIRDGTYKVIGKAYKGQTFITNGLSGDYHRINLGSYNGFIHVSNTELGTKNEIKNINNSGYTKDIIVINETTGIIDISSGKWVTMIEVYPGTELNIIDSSSQFYKVTIGNRVGYLYKNKASLKGISITKYNLDFNRAVEIQMLYGDPKYDGAGRISADEANVRYYLNPNNFEYGTDSFLQFMVLDNELNLPESQLNQLFLKGAGILDGKGKAFKDASKQHNLNELYLIAHALHETSNGSSNLALGIGVDKNGNIVRDENGNFIRDTKDPRVYKVVYNMYGYGAYDSNPTVGGVKYAFENGWFSPEAAIIGGAKDIANQYIKNGQNTLYKMKWDPESAANTNRLGKQYATHIMWADIQAKRIYKMLGSNINNVPLAFDVPEYINQPSRDKNIPPPPSNNNNNDLDIVKYPNNTVGITTVSNLRLRTGPSLSHQTIKQLDEGTILEVIGENNNSWLKVKVRSTGEEGWVSRIDRNNNSMVYVDILNLFKVNASTGLIYRDNPAGQRISTFNNGQLIAAVLDSNQNLIYEEATLNGQKYNWIKVYYENNKQAWVSDEFIIEIK